MAEEEKVDKASHGHASEPPERDRASDVDEKKSRSTPPPSGRRSSSAPPVFDTDDVDASTKTPADKRGHDAAAGASKHKSSSRLGTLTPGASSQAAQAAANKVPPPPGVGARTVPPPERHVPAAAPPGIGRMEEKLNSLAHTLRNYVVVSIVLLVAFSIALVVEARTGWLHVSATGQTFGKIYVDKPKVVSRERLVHDRAVQDEWLRALLGTSGPDPKRASTRTVASLRPAGDAKQGNAAPQGSAQAPRVEVPEPPAEVASEQDRVGRFQEQLAFRNQVRAELVENLLDDGKGPAQNTLYLLRFDSSMVPEERTTAFGVVRVDVRGGYGKAIDGAAKPLSDEAAFDARVSKLLERPEKELVALGELHQLFERSLKTAADRIEGEQAKRRKLIQDALRSNTAASDDTPWLGGVKPDSSPAEQWADAALEELDADDLYAFSRYLETSPTTREASSDCPAEADLQAALRRVDCVLDKLTSGKGRGKRAARDAKLEELYAAFYVAEPGAPLAQRLAPFATLRASRAGVVVDERVLEAASDSPPSWFEKAERYALASETTRVAAAAPQPDGEPEAGGEGADEAPAAPQTERVSRRHVGFVEFLGRVLASEPEVFTHAVGQSTNQRWSDGAGLAEVLRGADVEIDAALLRTTLSDVRRKSRLMNAVERNPMVVGFSVDLLEPARENTASLGWLLGPSLELSAGELDAKFTQRPVHNVLSAVVSVPSWWRRMRVDLVPFWLTRDGVCFGVDGQEQSCKLLSDPIGSGSQENETHATSGTAGAVSFEVALPGDERGVQEIVLPDAGLDRPTVFTDRLEAVTVRAGQPASIVIPGQHLWKNSTVSLGAQTAESVSVLPDSSGIVAKFDRVLWPGAAGAAVRYRGVPLDVWTSQGRAHAGQVLVYPESPQAAE